jgi:cysteine desulfurase
LAIPNSIHEYGRKTRSAIEKSRKTVAQILNASTAEIFFTSCGTESNNMILKQAVASLGVRRIISSPTEHHCVLHSVKTLEKQGVKVEWLAVNEMGEIDSSILENLLAQPNSPTTLVSLMHANNEIGTMIDLENVALLCKKYNSFFHSDTVQTVAHKDIDLQKIPIDFISGSAHKFHGPKGIGFVYIKNGVALKPFIDGGAQERNMRAGTENVAGIVGLGKAMEIWNAHKENQQQHLRALKSYMISLVKEKIPLALFNGRTDSHSLDHVLSISLPANTKTDLLLFNLDIAGICASGASACASGSLGASHVMEAIKAPIDRRTVRFSFSKILRKRRLIWL